MASQVIWTSPSPSTVQETIISSIVIFLPIAKHLVCFLTKVHKCHCTKNSIEQCFKLKDNVQTCKTQQSKKNKTTINTNKIDKRRYYMKLHELLTHGRCTKFKEKLWNKNNLSKSPISDRHTLRGERSCMEDGSKQHFTRETCLVESRRIRAFLQKKS